MKEMLNIFTTRELAVMIWLVIGLVVSLFSRDIRKSYHDIIKSFLARKIIITTTALIFYIACIIFLLWAVHLWNRSLIKDTIFWFVLTAFVPFISLSKIRDDPHFFRKAVKKIITFTIFTEFALNYFTFSLQAELILMPVLWLIAGMIAFSGFKKEHAQVNALLQKVFKCISVVLLVYVVYQLINHWRTFFTWETARELSLSPLLSLLYLPFVYALILFVEYEDAFIGLQHAVPPGLLGYTRWRAIRTWRGDREALERWLRRLQRSSVNSKHEIVASIADMKTQLRIEAHPPDVNPEYGWSPYVAKNFMKQFHLPTRDYENYTLEEWSCTSNHFYPNKEDRNIHISYSIEGNRYIAQTLTLRLTNWSGQTEAKYYRLFADYCDLLCMQALQAELPTKLRTAIQSARPKNQVLNGADITIRVHAYNNLERWQDIAFTIHKIPPGEK